MSLHGRAIGFLGLSGQGKSTLALSFAGAGWDLLGDDCLVLRTVQGGVEALPTLVEARLWPDSVDALLSVSAPLPAVSHYSGKRRVEGRISGTRLATQAGRLARLFLLSPEDDPRAQITITRIEGRHAFESLVQHVMRLPVGRDVVKREFEFLARLAADVPLRRLQFPHAFDQLGAVRAAVLADLPEVGAWTVRCVAGLYSTARAGSSSGRPRRVGPISLREQSSMATIRPRACRRHESCLQWVSRSLRG